MRKIPTVFLRDPDNMQHITKDPNPVCDWVFAGEGIATRKYDGTCVMLDDDGTWWARREVKPGKKAPDNYLAVETDSITGKTVGWEPVEQSAFAKYHAEALANERDIAVLVLPWRPGTYELIGPKIQGNPERAEGHMLIWHEGADRIPDFERSYEVIQTVAGNLKGAGVEGIVFHNPDGRMAKIKVRDFPA